MENLQQAMLTMVNRMAAAGWIASSAVTPEGINVVWTDEGFVAMRKLARFMATLEFPLSADEQACLIYLVSRTLQR